MNANFRDFTFVVNGPDTETLYGCELTVNSNGLYQVRPYWVRDGECDYLPGVEMYRREEG